LEHLGVARCLAKPFDVAELLAVVEQLARPNR
jgi:DNA-binding response OmpR family regulator